MIRATDVDMAVEQAKRPDGIEEADQRPARTCGLEALNSLAQLRSRRRAQSVDGSRWAQVNGGDVDRSLDRECLFA